MIERSIITTYRKSIFGAFVGAIKDYRMISPEDKIAVCISGGKDSMLMAKLFCELSRHGDYPINLEFIVMNPGYSPESLRQIMNNASLMKLPVRIFEANIFPYVSKTEKNPCYLCARMRRGHLYKAAQDLGCNKIALGHHFDDVIETILMGMLYGAQIQTMMPRIKSTSFPGMELIRPMYYIREAAITAWRDFNNLEFLNCACHFTEQNAENGAETSKRLEIKNLIRSLKKTNPQIEMNIFRSVRNVNLETILGYHNHSESHYFMENFDS